MGAFWTYVSYAIVLVLAAVVLLCTVRVHRKGSAALLHFADWVSETQDRLIAALPTADLDSAVARMSETVEKMDRTVAALGDFGEAISSARGLGDEMSNASREIASAVEKLPDNINSSIVNFSGEVARNISESLAHHPSRTTRSATGICPHDAH
jgi:uncharacterized protein YoxC